MFPDIRASIVVVVLTVIVVSALAAEEGSLALSTIIVVDVYDTMVVAVGACAIVATKVAGSSTVVAEVLVVAGFTVTAVVV